MSIPGSSSNTTGGSIIFLNSDFLNDGRKFLNHTLKSSLSKIVDINAASARQGDRKSVPDGSYATGQFCLVKVFNTIFFYLIIQFYVLGYQGILNHE